VKGHQEAQLNLAFMHHKGVFLPLDIPKALCWFRMAAANDHQLQFQLAEVLHYGLEGVTPNKAEGLNWYTKASEGGVLHATVHLCLAHMSGELIATSPEKVVVAMRRLANRGNRLCKALYAVSQLVGYGGPKDDEIAIHYLEAAMQQGSGDSCPEAGVILANLFVHKAKEGNKEYANMAFSVLQNVAKVTEGKKQHLELHAKTQLRIADMYMWGEGCERDWERAMHCYKLAAEVVPAAQYCLGMTLIEEGNFADGFDYLIRAADGNEYLLFSSFL